MLSEKEDVCDQCGKECEGKLRRGKVLCDDCYGKKGLGFVLRWPLNWFRFRRSVRRLKGSGGVFIGLEPSTQWSSWGTCLGQHNEAELAQDVCARLVPKLQAAGHKVGVFAGQQDANSDGARALVAAGADIAVSLHLDAAGGQPAALLCYQEPRSLSMGMTILNVYCKQMGCGNRGPQRRIPGINGVAVIRIPESAGIPTALIEMGDMNCPDGTSWLDPNHREKASKAMAVAICAVAGGVTPQPPKEEDDNMVYGKEFMVDDKTFDYPNCWVGKFNYFVFTSGAWTDLKFIPIAEGETRSLKDIPATAGQNGSGLNKVHNMQDIMNQPQFAYIKGSYRLIVTSSTPCQISLREALK